MTKLFALAMVACIAVACTTEESATPVASVSAAATSAACVCVCPGDDAAVPRPEAAADAATDVSLVSVDASASDAAHDAREASASEASAPAAGLHIVGNHLVDVAGRNVILKGPNVNHEWDTTDPVEVGKSGANSVRIVFGRGEGVASTSAQREAVVRAYLAQNLIPVAATGWPETTCAVSSASILAPTIAQWISDKAWLKALEGKVIVNIANEFGNYDAAWRDTYIAAVAQLRAAGINNVLMIDAGGACGQYPDSIIKYGAAIEAADPLHSVMFSIHMYAFWFAPGSPQIGTWQDDGTKDPYSTDAGLAALVATGLPIYVGEFSSDLFTDQVTYNTASLLASMDRLGVGGAPWMFLNNHNEHWLVDMTTDGTYAHLTTFGQQMVTWFRK